jgi:hypothetical protein
MSDFPKFDRAYKTMLVKDKEDRIEQLAAQANFNVYHSDIWRGTGRKFAELIIADCVTVISDAVDHREPASTYVDKIKNHFGME